MQLKNIKQHNFKGSTEVIIQKATRKLRKLYSANLFNDWKKSYSHIRFGVLRAALEF